jgi:CRP-like cAMP-binding protein
MAKGQSQLDLLSTVELFQGLGRKELQAVLDQSRELTFDPGAVVAAEGQAAGRFYLIVEGTAQVTLGGRHLASLHAGDYFGEISLIDGQPRSATVVAQTPLTTLSIASFNFRPMLLEHPAIMRKILLETCRRLRAVERSLVH